MQTEMTWRGERIVLIDYKPNNQHDTWGFHMKQAFVVRDEMDEPSLPTLQQYFWSPGEAVAAIEMRDSICPEIRTGTRWPTTVAYEFNQMLSYRANFDVVYGAIVKIKKALREAADFDENPAKEIKDILTMMQVRISERRPA